MSDEQLKRLRELAEESGYYDDFTAAADEIERQAKALTCMEEAVQQAIAERDKYAKEIQRLKKASEVTTVSGGKFTGDAGTRTDGSMKLD